MILLFTNKSLHMTSTPKKTLSFTRVLRIACAALEILIVVGMLFYAVLFPFAESNVRNGAHITISKDVKLGGFSYILQEHNLTVTSDSSATPDSTKEAAGSVTVGPISLEAGKAGQLFKGAALGKDVDVRRVEGMVAFTGPEKAPEALRVFKWPATIGEFCKMLMGLAFFEMIRRLLSSSEKGDLFTDANVRMLRTIAFITIVLDLIKFAAAAILTNRINAFVVPFFSDGTWILPTTMPGRLAGVISGISLLIVAEIFREGLKFRKDSDLTI
jgi:hypothetical protein